MSVNFSSAIVISNPEAFQQDWEDMQEAMELAELESLKEKRNRANFRDKNFWENKPYNVRDNVPEIKF